MKPVAVVGGGISGLTAGFRLHQLGLPVVLYEKQNRTGGVIRSERERGFLAESGPTSIRDTALVRILVRDLGLDSQKVPIGPNGKKRYLVRAGQLLKVPDSPFAALTTTLISGKAKLRILAEPFIRRAGESEESLADFVVRRLGREILDYAVDPLVGGMYAGRPESLSIRYAFPKLYDLEHRSGSLILGALSKGVREKRTSEPSGPRFSFNEGVQVLTDALHSKLGCAVRTGSQVATLAQTESGWCIGDNHGIVTEHSAVILAAPAPQVAQLHLSTAAGIDLRRLAKVNYAGVVRLLLGFKRRQLPQPLDGFGFLVPRQEQLHLLGSVFCSSVDPATAPRDHISFLCFLGGARRPELLDSDEESLSLAALRELQQLTGLQGEPVFRSYLKIPQAIPQYELGHGEVCALIDHAERFARGLFFAGNYRDGIAVSDALASGWNAANRLAGMARV